MKYVSILLMHQPSLKPHAFELQVKGCFWSLAFGLNSQTLCTQNGKIVSYKFKVCQSVHHHTIQINHKPDATVFQFIILTFIYSSTCIRRFPAHHQEPNDCSGSLWFYLCIMVITVLCSWSGRPARPRT